MVQTLLPALLGDNMLTEVPAAPSQQQLLQALLALRWGPERYLWSPLDDSTYEFNHSTTAQTKVNGVRVLHEGAHQAVLVL